MRYFRYSNVEKIILLLADEIINTSYNKKMYIDGILQEDPEEEYNTYINAGISYNFELSRYTIYLMTDEKAHLYICNSVKKLVEERIKTLDSCNYYYEHAYTVYPQLAIINDNCVRSYKNKPIKIQIGDLISNNTDFIYWNFTNKYDIPLKEDLELINNIFVDNYNLFDFPDGYRSINNFTPHDTVVKDKLCAIVNIKKFKVNELFNYLIHHFIDEYIFPLVKNKESIYYKKSTKTLIRAFSLEPDNNRDLNVLKYGVYWFNYKNAQLLYLTVSVTKLNIVELDSLQKFNPKIHKLYCCATGVPIYDAFFIIDVYEQKLTIKNGSDKENKKYEKLGYVKEGIYYTKTIRYDKPMQLAISAFAVNNIIGTLEHFKTIFKFILYQTQYEKTIHDVIDELNLNSAHKKFFHKQINVNKLAKYNYSCSNKIIKSINKSLLSYTAEDIIYTTINK